MIVHLPGEDVPIPELPTCPECGQEAVIEQTETDEQTPFACLACDAQLEAHQVES